MIIDPLLKFIETYLYDILMIVLVIVIIFLVLIRYCLKFRYFIFGTKVHLILVDKKSMSTLISTDNYRIFYSGTSKKFKNNYIFGKSLHSKIREKFCYTKKNDGIKFYIPRNKEINILILNTFTGEIVYQGEISGEEKREYLIQIKYNDQFNLKRFLDAQNPIYQYILCDLKSNKLRDDWVPFIFPRFDNCSVSGDSGFYLIKDKKEAEDFYKHPILGKRLEEFTMIVLSRKSEIEKIFSPKTKKMFHACMTLFALIIENKNSIFHRALNEIFDNKSEEQTQQLLSKFEN